MFGILNLNKPAGPTSRDCVNAIQQILRPVKVGHAGTLDPIANGVLLVLVGQAVRLTDAIHTLPKQYVGEFQLGVTSESWDIESPAISLESPPLITRQDIEQVLPSFTGIIQQTPPRFSAVWIGGKRAHELARTGQEFDLPQRNVSIYSLELTSFDYPYFELKMTCGTGTYVRSIGRDIATRLGSDAIMTRLTRTSIGPFSLKNSTSLDSLVEIDDVVSHLIPASHGVKHWPQAFPSDEILLKLEQGKQIHQPDLNGDERLKHENFSAVLDDQGRLRCLAKRLENEVWRADKCFLLREQ
jgi:tRNA pseudouridine55 synthase